MQLSDVFLDRLVKRITEERTDVFGAFYAPYLSDCARRIAGLARATPSLAEVADLAGVAESTLRSLMSACVTTGIRTLIASLHSADMSYEVFHAHVADAPGRNAILGRFPELDRLLNLSVDRATRTVEDVLHAVVAAGRPLDSLLGGQAKITALTPGLGDAHRGGRTVCLAVREDGTRAVYKPQQDNCQKLLDTLRALLDPDATFFGPLCPRSLVQPTHVWQEFVEHTDLDGTEMQSSRYFRRFGRAAALLSMIGATDLHHENVIASPDGPLVIDTETLVSLPGAAPGASPSAISTLNLDIEQSVLKTVLLPTRYTGAKLDVDISAIGCIRPGTSENLYSYQVVGAGTDDIRFQRTQVLIEHGSNMATVAGEPLDPRDWTDDIVAGYREARELLQAHQERVEAAIANSDDWAVRQVVRPTYVYARFLEASTHPAYLGNKKVRAELLGKLPHHYQGAAPESAQTLHQDEVAALLDLDIPFFTVDCDSTLIQGNLDREIRTAAGRTPRQSALAAVRSFFARPADRDPTYIRYALACSADDAWEPSRTRDADRGSRRTVFPDLTDPRAWHATLRDLVVGTNTTPTWLTPQLQGDGLSLGPVDTTLFGGGGLLIHLADTDARTSISTLGVDIARVCDSAMPAELVIDGSPLSMSPYTGVLSNLVTDWEIRRLRSPSARFPTTLTLQHGAALPDIESLTAADFDYLNGYSGYLVYLASYQSHGAPELMGIPPERLLQRLVTVDGDPTTHPGDELGLAHGRFGRIAAVSALVAKGLDDGSGARDHLERFAHAYGRHRWQDATLRDRTKGSGWCKGYAGVAYAAAGLLASTGESNGRIREAIAPEIERLIAHDPGSDIGPDISLCHGVAGRIAVLCDLADRLDWPELRSEAATLHTSFLHRYAEGGWTCGIGTEPHLPSFFLGLSGWFAAQSMLNHPGRSLPIFQGGH
ncbi:type 2 lanthipeptide synthetase LanM [Streptomyces sp. NPDC051578]|uniref:type 2 lanthipeptide synthetase LanM n=1 Tax=Streptomyces sp. NPDC051578 TaxID=3365662 RepID=UPI0037A080A1